jgi:hypothetical protein
LKVLLNIQKTSGTLFLSLLSYSTATIGRGVVKGEKESGQRRAREWPREGKGVVKGREREWSKGGRESGQREGKGVVKGREREWPREGEGVAKGGRESGQGREREWPRDMGMGREEKGVGKGGEWEREAKGVEKASLEDSWIEWAGT